jgi:hypothetical protein
VSGRRIRIRIRIVTRSRGRPLLEPSRLMGYDLVASALCDRDSGGHCSPFKAGVHKGPEGMLVRTAHKGAHAVRDGSQRGPRASPRPPRPLPAVALARGAARDHDTVGNIWDLVAVTRPRLLPVAAGCRRGCAHATPAPSP